MLSVSAAGMIVSICSSFFDEKSTAGVLCRIIGGVMITIMILSPFGDIRFEQVDAILQQSESAGEQQTDLGHLLASESQKEIIEQKVAAYILDKALELETELQVMVTIADGDLPIPESVSLSGKISPYARTRLQKMIAEDLGIPKECQVWIG